MASDKNLNFKKITSKYNSLNITLDSLIFYCFFCAFFSMSLGTSPMLIFAVIGSVIWLFSLRFTQIKNFYKNSWFWPTLAFIFLPWIALLYTPDVENLGLCYAGKTYYWIFCLVIASISFKIPSCEKFINAFLYGLALNVIMAIFQLLGIAATKGCGWYSGFLRGYSTLSAYLIIGILIISFYFKNCKSIKIKIFYVFVMLFYFFHLIILEGRTGYIAFIITLPLIIFNLIKFNKKNAILACLIFVIIVFTMLSSPFVRDRLNLTIKQLQYHINAKSENAWGKIYTINQDRFYMWHGAMKIVKDNPILGVGTGGYQTVLKNNGDVNDPLIAHPHNDLLYMGVHYGIIGILVFAWMFYEIFKNSFNERKKAVGYFVFSSGFVILVTGFFNAQILDSGMLFLFSVIVGMQQWFAKFKDKKLYESS